MRLIGEGAGKGELNGSFRLLGGPGLDRGVLVLGEDRRAEPPPQVARLEVAREVGVGPPQRLVAGEPLDAVDLERCAAIACRSARMPGPGGYWLTPWAMACCAASSMAGGPSSSGKPWPRLTASRRAANADIAAKMLTAKGCNRWTVAAWPATLGTVTARA